MAALKKGTIGKSLFKQQKKNDPEFLASQLRKRESLLEGLSRAVKELHLLFANQDASEEEGRVIEDCRGTEQLCGRFEEVLRHGLKAGWFGQSTSFWPVVLKVSRKQAIGYISSLQHAQSEHGKCRAWIRLAVNECSLESYINVLCQDNSLLSSYYEPYSFVRDEEMVCALTQLLAGLSQITFNMTVDTASLEFEPAPEAVNRVQPSLRLKTAEEKNQPTKVSSRSRTKKGRKHATVASRDREVEDNVSTGGLSESETAGSVPQSWSETTSVDILELDVPMYEIPSGDDESHDLSHVESHDHHDSNGEYDWDEYGDDDTVTATGTKESGHEVTLLEFQFENELSLHLNHKDYSTEQEANSFGKDGEEFSSTQQSDTVQNPFPEKLDQEQCDPSSTDYLDTGITHLEPQVDDSDIQTPLQSLNTNPFEVDSDLTSEDHNGDYHNENSTTDAPATFPSNNPFVEEEVSEPSYSSNLFEQLDASTPKAEELTFLSSTFSELNPFSSSSPPASPLSPTNPFHDDFIVSTNETQSQETHTYNDGDGGVGGVGGDSSLKTNPFHEPPTTHSSTASSTTWHSCSTEVHDRFPSTSPPPPAPAQLVPQVLSSTQLFLPHEAPPSNTPPLDPAERTPSDQYSLDVSPSVSPASDQKDFTSGPFSDDLSSYPSSADLSVISDMDQLTNHGYLQPIDNHFEAEQSMAELRAAIKSLRSELAHKTGAEDEDTRELRKRLVHMQLKLQHMKEQEEDAQSLLNVSQQEVEGHLFVSQPRNTKIVSNTVCEGCGKKIRGILRRWCKCKYCHCACHKVCLSMVHHVCSASKSAHLNLPTDTKYILEVCPERGLTEQQFRCASCNMAFNSTSIIARLCDYSGYYYCSSCHHNDLAVIPARVLHNWDFTPRKVCCRCSDLLGRLFAKPLVKVQSVNPLLYTYVEDLRKVEKLRKDILVMKKYFLKCQVALDTKLITHLDPFPHFKDDAKLFSLADLEAVQNGRLTSQLQRVHGVFALHIKQDCQVCYRKGRICELCGSGEVLFPFDRHVSVCPTCKTVFHKTCYSEMTACPKCTRTRSARKS